MYVNFYNDHSEEKFVDFGTSFFCLRNEKSNTFCQDLSQGFDGIADNTLTGKSNREKYACSRLVAIQLE